jgi:hypothetical protein
LLYLESKIESLRINKHQFRFAVEVGVTRIANAKERSYPLGLNAIPICRMNREAV